MAIEKVGIYRKYYGKVPTDKSGKALPKSSWPKKRAFSWAVRWFSSDGKRYSKSFKTRKEAERYAETKQTDCRLGKTDLPQSVNVKQFNQEHKDLMGNNLAKKWFESDFKDRVPGLRTKSAKKIAREMKSSNPQEW